MSQHNSEELVRRLIGRLSQSSAIDRHELIEWVRSDEPLLDPGYVAECVDHALARANGYGPINHLLQAEDVTEVMVNGPGPVWIDRAQGLVETDTVMTLDDIGLLIERILDPLGLRVDRVSPMVDARMPDGSRVNVVVPPLALEGPVVTIRRFAARSIPLDAFGPESVVGLLNDLVAQRATLLVVGGTGTGKTTLLNALGALLPAAERIVIVEDTSELRFPGRHVIRLEARPANSEGVGEVTLRQLVRNALRMRPDRLVIGEVRGGEALDLLLALNTGHRGSLTTCHANGPDSGLRRLETLCLLGGIDLPLGAIREQIGSAIDFVVHLGRTADGLRRISSVAEVVAGERPECKVIWSETSIPTGTEATGGGR